MSYKFGNILIACHSEETHGSALFIDEDGVFPLSDKITSEDDPYKEYLTINTDTGLLKQLSADKAAEYNIQSVSYIDIGIPEEAEYISSSGLQIKQYNRWANIADKSIDIIYALYCDVDINDSVAELYRVLKPGGKLIVIGNKLENQGEFEGGEIIKYDYATRNGMFVLINRSFLLSRVDSGLPISSMMAIGYMNRSPHYLFAKPDLVARTKTKRSSTRKRGGRRSTRKRRNKLR